MRLPLGMRVPIAAALLCVAPRVGSAQKGITTLGDVLAATERAAAAVQLRDSNQAVSRILDSLVAVIRAAGADSLRLDQFADIIHARSPDPLTVLHWRNERTGKWSEKAVIGAVTGIREIANDYIIDSPRANAAAKALAAPIDSIGQAIRTAADTSTARRLRAFEIKYGPESPRLNPVEAGINYVAQVLVPCTSGFPLCFGVYRDGSPSPFELVTSYSTTDVTGSNDTTAQRWARLVGSGKVGLRIYRFAEGWGDGGRFARLVRPGSVSLGMFLLGQRDAPFENPLERRKRLGAFFGWGDLHAGWVSGAEKRLVIGTGKQLVNHLF